MMSRWSLAEYKAYQGKVLDKKIRAAPKPKIKPRKTALKRADTEFSLLMRAIEADENGNVKCCTCSKVMPWKGTGNAHWGHWQSRGFNSVRWNVKNGGVQCRLCNTYLEGRKQDMERYLIERYGERDIKKVEVFAHITVKISEFELAEMAKDFRERRKAIVKVKGLV